MRRRQRREEHGDSGQAAGLEQFGVGQQQGRMRGSTGRSSCGEAGAGRFDGERERKVGGKKRKGNKDKRGRERKKERGGGKGKRMEVGGSIRETQKMEEGGCRKVGRGKGKQPGETRETLGFEVRWALGRGWATLSLAQKLLFFFCKLIWQLIFENGDDCLDKTFPTILAK